MPPRLRLAFPTRLFSGSLRDKIRQAAALRVAGTQWDLRSELRPAELGDTGRRHFHQLLAEQNLLLAPAVFSLRRALIDQQGLEERVAAIISALRFAAELKMNTLIVRLGGLPAEGSAEETLLVEVLNDLTRTGDHVGVTIAATNGREKPERLANILGRVQTGPIGVNFDPAALVMADIDPTSALTLWQGQVRHVRLRDGLSEADGVGNEVPVGRGDVPWQELFASLAEIDFEGWLAPDRTTGEQPADDAAAALRFIRNLLPFHTQL